MVAILVILLVVALLIGGAFAHLLWEAILLGLFVGVVILMARAIGGRR